MPLAGAILKRSRRPGEGNTTWPGGGGDTVLTEARETVRGLCPGPPLRKSEEMDCRDEPRPRALPVRLPFVEETSPKPAGCVRVMSECGIVDVVCSRGIEVIDAALPKILCAEDTGEIVSDL